jgi:hypothetical protein
MGKLIHFVHQSLDGFIEGPNGEFDSQVVLLRHRRADT